MNLRVVLLVVATLLSVAGLAHAGEIAKQHQEAVADKSGDNNPSKEGKHEITEIGIERGPCYGRCPVYTLIIKSDVTFRYHGEKWVDRKGDFTGKIEKEKWAKLTEAAASCKFMSLERSYTTLQTDSPTVFTMIVMDGQRKTISDYAGAGPDKLGEFEKTISDSIANAEWDKGGVSLQPHPASVPAKEDKNPQEAKVAVELSLDSVKAQDGTPVVSASLTIRNMGNASIVVQRPTNRQTVVFFVSDARGNLVAPMLRGKSDPAFGEVELQAGKELTQSFEKLEFVTGTALMGYDLKAGEKYRVVALYRPNGMSGPGFCSKEVLIDVAPLGEEKKVGTLKSMKGWELYVWQEDGKTLYSLLTGTNRNKTDDEIKKAAVKGVEEIKLKLDGLKVGEYVTISGRKQGDHPPKGVTEELIEHCKKGGLNVSAIGKD
jgi:hypothetical protein